MERQVKAGLGVLGCEWGEQLDDGLLEGVGAAAPAERSRVLNLDQVFSMGSGQASRVREAGSLRLARCVRVRRRPCRCSGCPSPARRRISGRDRAPPQGRRRRRRGRWRPHGLGGADAAVVSALRIVSVSQWPRGTVSTTRRPRSGRPRVRAIWVETPLSSR